MADTGRRAVTQQLRRRPSSLSVFSRVVMPHHKHFHKQSQVIDDGKIPLLISLLIREFNALLIASQFESLDYEDGESAIELSKKVKDHARMHKRVAAMRWVIMLFIGLMGCDVCACVWWTAI